MEGYEPLNNKNEHASAIINIHMLEKERTSRFPEDLAGIEYVPIDPLNTGNIGFFRGLYNDPKHNKSGQNCDT